jgi:hypothetical protein
MTIGALVVWKTDGSAPTSDDLTRCERYRDLTVTAVAMMTRPATRGQEARDRLKRLINPIGLEKREPLREVLKATLAVGFDRVRIFTYDEVNSRFVCQDSIGGREPDGAFSGVPISLAESPYAQYTVNDALTRPEAHIRSPEMFGTDPLAKRLKKPDDLEWVVAPIFFGDRLWGYIAADNASSRLKITDAALQELTLVADLVTGSMSEAPVLWQRHP